MLTKKAIEEFKTIYLKEEGKKISDSDAVIMANNLMNLFKTVSRKGFEHNPVSDNKIRLTKNKIKLT